MSNVKEFYISTISDSPKTIFSNLEIYEKKSISGIHFDIMDGNFVPRLGLYPELLKSIRNSTKLPIEVHIMTFNPDNHFEELATSGADRIIFHFESTIHLHKTIMKVKQLGLEVGVAINPSTLIENLEFVVNEIDVVLIMGINPGIARHELIPSTFKKIEKLVEYMNLHKSKAKIAIDGGVTFENLNRLFECGAHRLVCGSATVFNENHTIEKNIDTVFKSITK